VRRVLAVAAVAAVGVLAVTLRWRGDRWVVADAMLRAYPTSQPVFVRGGEPLDNFVVAPLEVGEPVAALSEDEVWSKVRTGAGKEGYVQKAFLAPRTATPAVALARGACYGRRLFGLPLDASVEAGRILFLERSWLGRWRNAAGGAGCPWVEDGFFSTAPQDVELAKLLVHAASARSARKRAELLDRARHLPAGDAARALLAAAAAESAPRRPPMFEPPPLAAGEVPASRSAGPGSLPVPNEEAGPRAGDAAFEIHPVQTDGHGFASVPPRFPVDWKALVRQHLPWVPIDVPPAPDSRPGQTRFRLPPPDRETLGRWYLATRHGVFAAKPAALQGAVHWPAIGQAAGFEAVLLLRPAPDGGAGFAFWSPAALRFRASPVSLPDPHYRQPIGLYSELEPDGRLAIVAGQRAEFGRALASGRARVDREYAPVETGYRLEVFPGGTYLFVALEDTSYAAYNVGPKTCRPALLLRWSDLAEVARAECDPR
jgi:hypothetical protein